MSLLSARVLAGMNISLADLVIVPVLFLLAAYGRLRIPALPAAAFTVIATITATVAMTLAPTLFNVQVDATNVLFELLKLTTSFLFLVVGYSLFTAETVGVFLRWFSISALALGALGALLMVQGSAGPEAMFVGGRFIGTVNDPNLCSVLLLSGTAYFMRPGVRLPLKLMVGVVALAGVLATGSKTGLVVAVLYSSVVLFRVALRREHPVPAFGPLFVAVAVPALLAVAYFALLPAAQSWFADSPTALRALEVFRDPDAAFNDGGSARGLAFGLAITLIRASPLVGVGIGTYPTISASLIGAPLIAHNTYLQISAEWGLLLGVPFLLGVVAFVVSSAFRRQAQRNEQVVADICLIVLLGGLSISLNNVRVFWLCLGVLIAMRSKSAVGGRWGTMSRQQRAGRGD